MIDFIIGFVFMINCVIGLAFMSSYYNVQDGVSTGDGVKALLFSPVWFLFTIKGRGE